MSARISQLLALFVIAPMIHAQSVKSKRNCESDLTTNRPATAAPAPYIDYAVSDLEGTFLLLMEKVQALGQVEPGRHESYIRETLNLKAQVLNQITDLMPFVLRNANNDKKMRAISSIYQMLDSIGVPPKIFGLEINDKQELVIPQLPAVAETPKAANENQWRKPIGFLAPLSRAQIDALAPARDLPDHVHRSIGFGEFQYRTNAAPARRTGEIRRQMNPDHPTILVVKDLETGAQYYADIRVLTSAGGQIDGKNMQLTFNNETREWMVLVENLNNPSGRIGF